MKASELRIGNLIQLYRKPIDKEKTNHIVKQIGDDLIMLVDGFLVNTDAGIEPIPLTEEWLIKFDWDMESMEDGLICYDLVYDDIINQYHFYIYSVGGNKINCALLKHVHQLQNLYFALTGEELEITT